MKRVSPLLERDGGTRVLDIAPAPWVVRQCNETGFVFLENPPGYDSLREELAWEVTSRRESRARATAEPARYAISTAVKRVRHDILKRNKMVDLTAELAWRVPHDEIRLLDLGCGAGQLLGLVMDRLPPAVRQRCRPHGIEISNELAARAQRALAAHGGSCIHEPALDGLQAFADGYLDVIVMSSYLEHEIQPMPLLRACAKRLRDGGRIVIKVPNHACWNRALRGSRWCGYRWPDHVNYFTPRTLRACADAAGLRVWRLSWLDRLPISDSLYAVLQRAP